MRLHGLIGGRPGRGDGRGRLGRGDFAGGLGGRCGLGGAGRRRSPFGRSGFWFPISGFLRRRRGDLGAGDGEDVALCVDDGAAGHEEVAGSGAVEGAVAEEDVAGGGGGGDLGPVGGGGGFAAVNGLLRRRERQPVGCGNGGVAAGGGGCAVGAGSGGVAAGGGGCAVGAGSGGVRAGDGAEALLVEGASLVEHDGAADGGDGGERACDAAEDGGGDGGAELVLVGDRQAGLLEAALVLPGGGAHGAGADADAHGGACDGLPEVGVFGAALEGGDGLCGAGGGGAHEEGAGGADEVHEQVGGAGVAEGFGGGLVGGVAAGHDGLVGLGAVARGGGDAPEVGLGQRDGGLPEAFLGLLGGEGLAVVLREPGAVLADLLLGGLCGGCGGFGDGGGHGAALDGVGDLAGDGLGGLLGGLAGEFGGALLEGHAGAEGEDGLAGGGDAALDAVGVFAVGVVGEGILGLDVLVDPVHALEEGVAEALVVLVLPAGLAREGLAGDGAEGGCRDDALAEVHQAVPDDFAGVGDGVGEGVAEGAVCPVGLAVAPLPFGGLLQAPRLGLRLLGQAHAVEGLAVLGAGGVGALLHLGVEGGGGEGRRWRRERQPVGCANGA